MSCPGPKQWFFLRAGHFYALFIPRNLFPQPFHNPFFQPRDIRLRDAQQVRDFFLRRLARAADAEAQQDDLPVALAECLDGAQEHGALRVVLERAAHGVGVRAENVLIGDVVAFAIREVQVSGARNADDVLFRRLRLGQMNSKRTEELRGPVQAAIDKELKK